MKLDAVLLDLGNVLAFHDNPLLFDRLAQAFSTTRERMRERLDDEMWERVNRGQLPGDSLRRELLVRLGGDVDPARFEAIWTSHFTLHTAMIDAVAALDGRYRLVLVSNTHDLHVKHLRPLLPVLERFDALLFSCEVGLLKPEPALFRLALAKAGCSPERAVFFDDLQVYADAASAIGIHGRLFTTVERFSSDLAALDD